MLAIPEGTRSAKPQNLPKVQNLAGLCKASRFDIRYSWTWDTIDAFYTLRGHTDAVIEFNPEQHLWQIVLYSTNETYATANVTDYPFGRQQWVIHKDSPCFTQGEALHVLNLNACNESEFNCADGQCIPMEERCDGVLNCDDDTGGTCFIYIFMNFC